MRTTVDQVDNHCHAVPGGSICHSLFYATPIYTLCDMEGEKQTFSFFSHVSRFQCERVAIAWS